MGDYDNLDETDLSTEKTQVSARRARQGVSLIKGAGQHVHDRPKWQRQLVGFRAVAARRKRLKDEGR